MPRENLPIQKIDANFGLHEITLREASSVKKKTWR